MNCSELMRLNHALGPTRPGALGWPRVFGFSCVFWPRGSALNPLLSLHGQMNDLAHSGNLIEAGFWFMVAVFLFIQAFRSQRGVRRILCLLSGAFFVFGVSDLIEAQTGAWWRPLWLLLLKSGCVLVFLFGFREYYRIRKSPDPEENR